MKYALTVERGGNAMSIITTYSLESMGLSLTLYNKKTGDIVAVEKYTSLEDIEGDNKGIVSSSSDMMSYLEVADLEAGDYEL
jgi:co-chaperonin GroES (HSP10)